MDLLITPTQLSRRAELYYQLGSLINAGIFLPNAIRQLIENPPSRSYRRPLELISAKVEEGCPFYEAVESTGWLSSFDHSLLRSGEISGRLDVTFKLLSKYYEQKAQMTRKTFNGLAYPVFLLHFGALLFPISSLQALVLKAQILPWFIEKIAILGPIYFVVIGLLLLFKLNRAEPFLEVIERIAYRVPFLGKAQRSMAVARLSVALESLLNAGVTVIEAWQFAAVSSGSVILKKEVLPWKERMENGQTPSELVNSSRAFPEMFRNLYAAGEISGQQDDTLRRLSEYYHEDSARKYHIFTKLLVGVVFAGGALYVGYTVVSFYAGYF
ncbi:MAG: type secretory pathway protein, partial [Verrucomicrobiales bacterium]|nr:type secretory pathway protein [Verrucomicrobiales bacterium]